MTVEVAIDGYTGYSLAVGSDSRLEKAYIRLPPWAVPLLQVQGAALDDPLDPRR